MDNQPNVINLPTDNTGGQPAQGVKMNKKWSLYIVIGVVFVVIVALAWFLRGGTQQANTNANNITPTINPLKLHDYPAVMRLEPSSDTLSVGNSVTVRVIIEASNKSLDGADAIILYDPNLLGASITSTEGFPQYPIKRVNNDEGKITLTGVTYEAKPAPIATDLIFAEISFVAKKAGKASITLDFEKMDKSKTTVIENGTSSTLLGSVENAEINISE